MNKPECIICLINGDFLMKKASYKLFKCPRCKLVYIYPQPTKKQLAKLYSSEFGYQSNKVNDLSLEKPRKNDLKIIKYLLGIKSNGKILDVGCSNGRFLYTAKQFGFFTYGVEINKGTAQIAKKNGLNVKVGTIETVRFHRKWFDIIFLGDVIEHINDPKRFIKKSMELLKNDGVIVISTPNLDCFWAKITYILYRLFQIPWSSATPPYHLFQFSPQNLNLLLKQLNVSSVHLWYNPPPALSYELWFTGLPLIYSKKRNLRNFLNYYFTYFLYAIFYFFNKLFAFIFGRDNSMVVIVKK